MTERKTPLTEETRRELYELIQDMSEVLKLTLSVNMSEHAGERPEDEICLIGAGAAYDVMLSAVAAFAIKVGGEQYVEEMSAAFGKDVRRRMGELLEQEAEGETQQ